MKKLSPSIVTEINQLLIQKYSQGETVGLKEIELLESAVNRPFQTMYGQSLYPDIFSKATALFESIAKNHVFHNGNKRTAFASFIYFLYINGYVCVMSDEVGVELTVGFVTGVYTFNEVVLVTKNHSYQKVI